MSSVLNRRTVLRGLLQGATVGVALPYLDCFLNGNGTALAAGGSLPVRFGTWFWGCGVTPGRWHPTKPGRDWETTPELKWAAPYKDKLTIFSGFDCYTDGKPPFPHGTAGPCFRTGISPSTGGAFHGPSFDMIIAAEVGTDTRFRSLEMSAIGSSTNSLSGLGVGQMNPTETSAARLYQRVFGEGFTDPNAGTFTPDPVTMARKSVLSVVKDQRLALERRLGVADRARLDQYFTALRQMENQLALQLQQPEPLVACKVPAAPENLGVEVAVDFEDVATNHEIMARLLAMALACNQTKVFNLAFDNGGSTLTRRGSTETYHQTTHDEGVDPVLGYQPRAARFAEEIMQAWGTFLSVLDGMPEGDGTLLDHTLVVAHSEVSWAKDHTITNLPVMFAGLAGGRVKSGLHVIAKGDPVSRIALTAMQVMGVSREGFGTGSMQTKKTIGEIVA